MYNKGYFMLALLFLIGYTSQGQSIKRQSIACIGSSNLVGHVLVQQTAGQPYATGGYYAENVVVLPGFQQSNQLTVEINQTLAKVEMQVWPNPAVSSVSIVTMESISNATIKITDINGRNVSQEHFENLNSHVVDCQQWPEGIYIMQVISGGKNVFSSKIIKRN